MHIGVVFREVQCFSCECNSLTPRSGVPVKPTVAQLVRNTSPFVSSLITLPTSSCYWTITSVPQMNSATPWHTIFKTILSVIWGYTPILSSSCLSFGLNVFMHFLRRACCLSLLKRQCMNTIIITCCILLLSVSAVPMISTTFYCEIPPAADQVSHLYKTNGKTAACMF